MIFQRWKSFIATSNFQRYKFNMADEFEAKRGRPASGQNPSVTMRFLRPLMARIDAYAAERFISRVEAIRELVEKGLGNGDGE